MHLPMFQKLKRPLVAIVWIVFGSWDAAAQLSESSEEFRDGFPRLDIKGGSNCTELTREVCLPAHCQIDFSRTYSTPGLQPGGYGQGGAGYGVFVNSSNNHRPEGYAKHVLDSQRRCLKSTVKVCAMRNQAGWYQGYHVIYGKCYQACSCPDGHWFDTSRKTCVTGKCDVAGMPDGYKGGKYFAWDGKLFIDTPCKACERLELPLATGTAAWIFADGPVPSMKGKTPLPFTPTPAGWGSLQGSSWLTASTDLNAPGGDYIYQLRFCLCPGFKNAALTMSVLADNSARIFINGNQIGTVAGPYGFINPPQPLSTTTQSYFRPGPNVLSVHVNNLGTATDGSYTGFLVGGQITAEGGQCPACENPCPLIGSYDSVNCFVGQPPPNTTAFIYAGNFYYSPVSGNQCPLPGSKFDGSNCFVTKIPLGAKPFIWSNMWYVEPTCRP